jgi:ADP-ribose pyrophosphatase YjhB (NUDIX family)
MADRPDPASLASEADAVHRVHERAVDRETFARMRERIDGGLDWGVAGLATDPDGRVLLVYENDRWLLPGGEVEDGETLTGALVREFREETGLDVAVSALLSVTEQTWVNDGERVAFCFAIYRVAPDGYGVVDDPGLADEEIEAVEWFERLPEETLDRELLADLLD